MVLRTSGPRAWVMGMAGVLLIIASGCSADGAAVDVEMRSAGGASPTPTVERGPVRDDRYPDEAARSDDTGPADPGGVAVAAETVVRDGNTYVEITIESDAPDDLDLWAIELDGAITTRTSDNPGSTLGVALAPFGLDDGEPFEVVVIAEDEQGAAIANSEALVLSAPVGPLMGADWVPDPVAPDGHDDEQDSGARR
ncbi:MAG: hypothetical protein S0880_37730 [Actinomycetota bacterium]|nr:hypothetical protein [Actinomycetota bacterium]